MKNKFIDQTRRMYGIGNIPLHRPVFNGNEKEYLSECIDSNFVSSVGKKVDEFEHSIANFTGSKYAIATMNGTSALHISILLSNVEPGDEVISQALTFIATCNAISYAGAIPVFVDVDLDTLGMSPEALEKFLDENAEIKEGNVFNKHSGRKISACIPMHTFGFPCRIEKIKNICKKWGIGLIEDAAESLGSYVDGKHTGSFGDFGVFSFNGNKILTTGGGGMVVTDDEALAKKVKHLTTTAKRPHAYEFFHDCVGYNYRMPNINAALGCAQMEQLSDFLILKEDIANQWRFFFNAHNIKIITPTIENKANYWLNAIILDSKEDRNDFLEYTNKNGIMTRPIWNLMSNLPMFKHCQNDGLINSIWLEERIINIPSSVPNNQNIEKTRKAQK